MHKAERQQEILRILIIRRKVNVSNLAREFGVCDRTIKYDLEALALKHPIITKRGRYGYVQLEDWYHPPKVRVSTVHIELLVRLEPTLEGKDQEIMHSLILLLTA